MQENNLQQPSPVGRWIAFGLILGLLAFVFSLAVKNMMPERSYPRVDAYEPWTVEVVEAAKAIPIQNGGRVKPLETFAGYMLLSFRGDRSIKVVVGDGEEKVEIGPTEWLLDTLFRPQISTKLPTFRVDNSDVFETIGMEGKERRDRYSYDELDPHRQKLFEVGAEFEALQEKGVKLSTEQKQTFELARSVRSYEALLGYFTFARSGVEFQGFGEGGESERKPVSVVMSMASILQEAIQRARESGEMPPRLQHILQQVTDLSNLSRYGLMVLPPRDPANEEWLTAGNLMWDVTIGSSASPEKDLEDIKMMEEVAFALVGEDGGQKKFAAALKKWQGNLEERARSRDEYRAIPTELAYNRGDWFFRATFLLFVPACLFLVLSWLSPRSKFAKGLNAAVWILSVAGFAFIAIGTTQRVIITERPPVTTLYDTIPFITGMIVLVACLVEGMTRRRIALAIAPIIGFTGLVLARLHEFGEASDPNDPLLAVLRSNFWLSTHVLTITFGYAAGLLTACLGLVYMFLRILKLDGGDKKTRSYITRMTYGCVCFTLFLSLVGTVLGGIWANYSWGRFWGWDPKENGALMIVIWMLFILHARMGGYIKEWGINLCAIFGAMVVTFSWWHVNLLGVGLHSYGFSESKKQAVFMFYGLMAVVLLVGIGFAMYDYFATRAKKKRRREITQPMPEGMPVK